MSTRILLVIALAPALIAAGCGANAERAEPDAVATAVQVGSENVVTVKRDTIVIGPILSGELRPQREATVRAEVGGAILQVAVEEGQPVRRGALLGRIEAETLENARRSAETGVRSATNQLTVARREAERTEQLVAAGALAARDLDVARNTVAAAEAQLADARARLVSARDQLSDAVIRSPITGVVSQRAVNAGDVVTPGTALFTIIDPSSIRLEASVPSEELGALRVGARVQFTVRGYNQRFEGRIARISPSADPVTRQVPIFVEIPNVGGRLVAGLYAEGRVLSASAEGLVVPSNAMKPTGESAGWVLRVADGKALPATGILGASFFPVTDDSEFNVAVDTPPGSNLQYTRIKALDAARLAKSKPEVLYTYTTVGGRGEAVDEATLFVKLAPKHERDRHQEEVAAELRRELGRTSGVTAAITTGGFGDQKQIQLQLQGPDVATLTKLANEVAAVVRNVPGAVDVDLSTKGQKPELDVVVDRGLAGSLGVTVGQVAQALRPAFAGIDAGDWIDPSRETRDVTIRLTPEARTSVQDLESLPLLVQGPDGTQATIPLGQVARIVPALGPARIDHLDRGRVIAVQANTYGRPLSEVIADISARVQQRVKFPPGYSLRQGGETEDQQEVFGRILTSLAIAIMLMYFVLVVQFGSFLDPLSILLSLPLSLIGVMLALLITGSTLNLMSMIGVILLMGIVAKNAILLIDFAKWSEEKGMERREALIQAGRVRLRPILMTTFALIAGMVPVALGVGEGADFRAPLGIAVIGGVMTSTVLTLLVIPTVYEILADWRDWLLARFAKPRAHGVRLETFTPHTQKP